MKPKLAWSFMLALALAIGLLAWLTPSAQSGGSRAPTPVLYRYVSPSGLDTSDCSNPASPCLTIGFAISQSVAGNQINVAAGTYTEHITMVNGISIYGQGWDSTIINGNYSMDRATVYISSVDASTVISGVKITGGGSVTTTPTMDGGGIAVWYASPKIINTWVFSNTARYGGGVFVSGGSPTFDNVPAWNNQAFSGGGYALENNAVVTITGNFTLTNGTVWSNYATSDGGGFFMQGVTATLSGLRIYWNSVGSGNGGGIYIGNTSNQVTLLLNDISGNSAYNGGGIMTYNATNLRIVGNLIGNWTFGVGGNTATLTGGSGGGAWFNQSTGLVQLNWFIGNKATNGYGGGAGIAYGSAGLTLDSNWLENNFAHSSGGGLSLDNGAAPQVNANTIVTNTAYSGGGIDVNNAGAVTITNNIIARNVVSPTYGGGISVGGTPAARLINNTISDNSENGVYFYSSSGISIYNNILTGNAGIGIYSADGSTFNEDYNDLLNGFIEFPGGAHDLFVNPLYVGSGDIRMYYHLQATSPVSKTGSLSWAPAKDIDGQSRILCASMGADQLNCVTNRLLLPLIKK